MAAPLVIWDEQMLGYDLGGRHPMHPDRWVLSWALASSLAVLDGLELVRPQPADDATLQLVHTSQYIEAVKRASGPRPAPLVGHGIGSDDNPAFPNMHSSAALIAGGSVAGASAIAHGEVDRAVNIAGGLHHAKADAASGFCVYNDAALAIVTLLAEGVERVAYIDVDVHHGDGVQAAFYDDPRVLTVSIHQTPQTLWPGTGWPHELGRGAAAGTSVNIPLPAGTGDADWHRAFTAIVPSVVRAFAPQVLVTQHGVDSHREDPLADLNLTIDGQRESYVALRRLAEQTANGRWLALGGGGYSVVRVVPRSWTNLLAIVADRDIDPQTVIPQDWTERALRCRPHIEPPTTMTESMTHSTTQDRAASVEFTPWDGQTEMPIDHTIDQVRRSVFPLHGLDPFDPRD